MIGVEALGPSRHERSGFECGSAPLDDWLRRYAHQNDVRSNTGRTWVAVDSDAPPETDGRRPILGYVTVAAHGVALSDARAATLGGAMPDPVPSALIARLAVDRKHQGLQLGGRLLRYAVERVVLANRELAVTLIVVDAIDEAAAAFYRHHGFLEVPGTSRLLARTSDAAAGLEL